MSRNIYIKSIINSINNASDNVVTCIYNNVWELCEDTDDDKKESRTQKIKYIKSNLGMVSDENLRKLDEIIKEAKEQEEKYNRMYTTLLDVLNDLLEHLDMEKIDGVSNFKDISRDILTTDDCNQIVLDKRDDLINAGFEKNANGFHSYKNLKYAHINILKGLCKQIGYKFSSIKKSKMIRGERSFTTYYYIESDT